MQELSAEEQKTVNAITAAFPKFEEEKKVDASTPMVYLTNAISKQLIAEDKGTTFLAHAVDLLLNKPDEAKEILERAGYEVAALPKGF